MAYYSIYTHKMICKQGFETDVSSKKKMNMNDFNIGFWRVTKLL